MTACWFRLRMGKESLCRVFIMRKRRRISSSPPLLPTPPPCLPTLFFVSSQSSSCVCLKAQLPQWFHYFILLSFRCDFVFLQRDNSVNSLTYSSLAVPHISQSATIFPRRERERETETETERERCGLFNRFIETYLHTIGGSVSRRHVIVYLNIHSGVTDVDLVLSLSRPTPLSFFPRLLWWDCFWLRVIGIVFDYGWVGLFLTTGDWDL